MTSPGNTVIISSPAAETIIESATASRTVDNCAICLEPVSERAITAPCNHALFDYLCLLTWLLDHDAKCPLCKTEVKAVSYDFYSPTDFKTFRIPTQPAVGAAKGTHSHHGFRADHSSLPLRQYRRRRRSSPPPQPTDDALEFRKHVYRRQLYSLHVGANRISNYRNFTPRDFSASSELQSRARAWLRRELGVFDFLDPKHAEATTRQVSNAEFLIEYILAMLKKVDIKDSNGRAEHLLQEFLGRSNARLFLHELAAWLRSPFGDLKDWDSAVQYPEAEAGS